LGGWEDVEDGREDVEEGGGLKRGDLAFLFKFEFVVSLGVRGLA